MALEKSFRDVRHLRPVSARSSPDTEPIIGQDRADLSRHYFKHTERTDNQPIRIQTTTVH